MKVIYTYWTNFGSDKLMGFSNKPQMLTFFQKSVESAKEFVGDVEIYTDKYGEGILKDLKSAKITVVDFPDFDVRFWNMSKLYVYSLQTEPFLHTDIDVIFKEKVLVDSDIVTEKVRGTVILNSEVYPPLSEDIIKHAWIVCSGIIGGTDISVFKELYSISSRLLDNIKNHDVTDVSRVAIEEIVLTHLIKKKGLKVKELSPESFLHYQGNVKKGLTLNKINNL